MFVQYLFIIDQGLLDRWQYLMSWMWKRKFLGDFISDGVRFLVWWFPGQDSDSPSSQDGMKYSVKDQLNHVFSAFLVIVILWGKDIISW
jgi:hypothetical protein